MTCRAAKQIGLCAESSRAAKRADTSASCHERKCNSHRNIAAFSRSGRDLCHYWRGQAAALIGPASRRILDESRAIAPTASLWRSTSLLTSTATPRIVPPLTRPRMARHFHSQRKPRCGRVQSWTDVSYPIRCAALPSFVAYFASVGAPQSRPRVHLRLMWFAPR